MFSAIAQDLKFAIRALLRQRAYTVAALLVLTLGVGANGAIFSVTNGILLTPLPYDQPDELVRLWASNPEQDLPRFSFTKLEFDAYRNRTAALAELGGYFGDSFTIGVADETERLTGARVTPSFFPTLGTGAAAGRLFLDSDRDDTAVAVLAHGLWTRRYGADPGVIGDAIQVDGRPVTIIGVADAGFRDIDGEGYEIFLHHDYRTTRWTARWLDLVGRLAPSVTEEQLYAELDALAPTLGAELGRRSVGWKPVGVGLHTAIVGDTRGPLLMLQAVVGFVLLIAAVNLANLTLARGVSRTRETELKLAIGAGKARIVGAVISETALIGIIGGLLGVLLSVVGVKLLIRNAPAELPRVESISVDSNVLLVSLSLALLAGVLAGILAVWKQAHSKSFNTLTSGGASSGRAGNTALGTLVATEFALALTLVIASGLTVKSFVALSHVDTGFANSDAMTMRIALPSTTLSSMAATATALDQILEATKGLPGVESAAVTAFLPLTGQGAIGSLNSAERVAAGNEEAISLQQRVVSDDYFATLGIELLEGRLFRPTDTPESGAVVLVSRSAAETLYPRGSAVGKVAVRNDGETGPTIIGVVDDVKHVGLETESELQYYQSHRQWPWNPYYLIIRGSDLSPTLASAAMARIGEITTGTPVYDIGTTGDLSRAASAAPRFNAIVVVGFAVVALLLAAVGIFGVLSFLVSQRQRELGIRIAIGAQSGQIIGTVMRRSFVWMAGGTIVGLAMSLALARVVSSLLFGVNPIDYGVFVGAAILQGTVGLIASFLPARRANKLDPVRVLRSD